MNDDRLLSEVRLWLQEADAAPPDATQSARDIRARLPRARRSARRWWLARAQRVPPVPLASDGSPSSTSAAVGRHQHITGRTTSMFGLSRIIAIGLVTLAVGGVMFVARPFDPPEGTRPGAEAAADPAAPVEFTGTGTEGACEVPATTDAEGPVAHTRGASCGPTYTFSDERLDGTVTWSSNVDEYVGGSGLVIQSVAMSIENDDGAWRMLPILSVEGPGSMAYDPARRFVLMGEGGYEGLIAVVDGFRTTELHGYIIDGELPPAPSNAHQDQPQG